MTPEQVRREMQEHEIAVSNFREHCSTLANRLIDAGLTDAAGCALVLDRVVHHASSRALLAQLAQVAGPEVSAELPPTKPTARKRAQKGQGSHRHKFDGLGKCACGETRKRAPRGSKLEAVEPARASGVLPAVGLPAGYRAPIGDDADDRFDGGAFGSSSAMERRR